ncbi:nuclear transport factor 2 (NTF2) superfamily protein [Bradyrhizobium sp. USDA 10063]
MTMPRPSSPPFSWKTATEKVRAMEDSWNSREARLVALDYTIDSVWRTGIEFLSGRAAIEVFLARKWAAKHEYRRINELWAVADNRIAARFAYECHDASGNWYRAYGNENWELDSDGLIRQRFASINEHPIMEGDRIFLWPLGRRPDDFPELSDFDF